MLHFARLFMYALLHARAGPFMRGFVYARVHSSLRQSANACASLLMPVPAC